MVYDPNCYQKCRNLNRISRGILNVPFGNLPEKYWTFLDDLNLTYASYNASKCIQNVFFKVEFIEIASLSK